MSDIGRPGMAGQVVVVGCAKAQRSSVAPIIEVLTGRGFVVELVSGLERSTDGWLEAIERIGNFGLYMLCGSDEFPRSALDTLRNDTVARGIRIANTWAGLVDWAHPESILIEVERLSYSEADDSFTVRLPLRSAPPLPANSPAPPAPPPSPAPSAARGTAAGWAVHSVELLGEAASGIQCPPSVVPTSTPRRGSKSIVGLAVGVGLLAGAGIMAATIERPAPPRLADLGVDRGFSELGEAKAVAAAAAAARKEADASVRLAQQDAAVVGAVGRGELTSVGVLLIAPGATDDGQAFVVAESRCAELDVAGVRGWRLPRAGEYSTLAKAGALANKGAYWSSTLGDVVGAQRLLWNAKKKRLGHAGIEWTGGRSVCVRFRRAQDAPGP